MAILHQWAEDENYHVRRLVSEGTRPRLPWAARLPEFIQAPSPVMALLEKLKDDPELYVRRSVANNLNDIGKDHPKLLANTAKRWLKGASQERQWLVKHALRSAIKRGEKGALDALGYGAPVDVDIKDINIMPAQAQVGGNIHIAFKVKNVAKETVNLMVDVAIHFIKANGASSAKVFKLKAVALAPNETQVFSKKISLKPMTTRTLYSGEHKVDVILNGQNKILGSFALSDSKYR